jgi:hypothetical protein
MSPMSPSEHNEARWVVVRYRSWSHGFGHTAGWYIDRVCPCHFGEAVSLPYPTRERAERVRQLLVGEASGPTGYTRLELPARLKMPAPAAGQIWREWEHGGDRYLRIDAIDGDRVHTTTVQRSGSGWEPVPTPRKNRAALLRRFGLTYGGGYMFIEGETAHERGDA